MPLILSKTNKKEIKEKVDEMLEFVGLADKKINFQMNYQADKTTCCHRKSISNAS